MWGILSTAWGRGNACAHGCFGSIITPDAAAAAADAAAAAAAAAYGDDDDEAAPDLVRLAGTIVHAA